MHRVDNHFAPTIARGELNVQEYRHPLFPYVVVSVTRCDAGCLAAFVTGSRSSVELEMIRFEWPDVVHWYAGPDYDGLAALDGA
ncbi:MAG: hypothetical protein JWO85_2007 [Candidatus Eremiobacteraeota bacterium]|nr:hypothetical protein [Candidatus Eremiobacteraeota bacterium]